MNGEFLKFLMLTEAARKVDGHEHMGVTDADVVLAKAIDALEELHRGGALAEGHEEFACVDCVELVRERAVLREGLHSRGIDLPVEVFQPS